MTAQIQDRFHFNSRTYDIAGISEGELFDPHAYGLTPKASCTACWRGYQAEFNVQDSALVLENLRINLFADNESYEPVDGPVLNTVAPQEPDSDSDLFNNYYEKAQMPLEYSGGVLLGTGFIRELYVHMGFHPAWKYEKVLELVFDKGTLQSVSDRSAQMEDFRKQMLEAKGGEEESRPPGDDQIRSFIERAFDRSYSF
jgi:hypothetical protein